MEAPEGHDSSDGTRRSEWTNQKVRKGSVTEELERLVRRAKSRLRAGAQAAQVFAVRGSVNVLGRNS
jgi:hypothetical protein